MRILTTSFFLVLSFVVLSQGANSCNYNAVGYLFPSNTCNTVPFNSDDNSTDWFTPSGCGAGFEDDVWGYFSAQSSSTTITFTPTTAGTNPIMHLFTGGCGALTNVACANANGVNGSETITFATVPGTVYRIRVQNAGSNATMNGNICVVNAVPANPSNTTCARPSPICSGTPINFTANTGGIPASSSNPGNNYSCLGTSPNPTWYYLEIATGGNLQVNITAGSDVDFAVWGPFPNIANAQSSCNSYGVPVDCSYSTSATEQMNVTGVTAGQVYILLVTNYANTVQNINVSNAGGSATTNCAIVPLPVGFSFWDVSMAGEDVVLMWETESEQHNSHFLVQRSADGLIWETIGIVEGNGTTSGQSTYSYRDQDPIMGMNYYRLNQVDTDGNSKLTSTLYVNTIKRSDLTVFPNPSKGIFTVSPHPKDVSEVYLTDMIGKRYQPQISESGETIIVTTENLMKGLYNLTVTVKGDRIVQKITLQ